MVRALRGKEMKAADFKKNQLCRVEITDPNDLRRHPYWDKALIRILDISSKRNTITYRIVEGLPKMIEAKYDPPRNFSKSSLLATWLQPCKEE